MDNTQLREKILGFSLDNGPRSNQGYYRVLLQLFGYAGHGKSSFINSCKYVMHEEEYKEHAMAGVKKDGGAMTMTRKDFELTKNITIVDNRGFSTMDSFERAEIYAQLGHFIPIGEEVKWTDNYTAMMNRLEEAELNPDYSDFIVPILIYSATCGLSSREEVQTFMENCVKMTGIFPIIVITKRNSGVFNNVKEMLKGMGAKVIIPIENYTKEEHEKTQEITEGILTIIDKALEDVTFRLGQERNPRRDWVQRKKFLLEYIHQADLEKEKKQWRIDEEKEKIGFWDSVWNLVSRFRHFLRYYSDPNSHTTCPGSM